jgi:hypothetical protein
MRISIPFALALVIFHAALGRSEEGKNTILGFSAEQIEPADPEKPAPLARVFTEYIYPSDVGADGAELDEEKVQRLNGLVFGRLRKRYAEHHELKATRAEIESFGKAMSKVKKSLKGVELEEALQSVGNHFVLNWKIDKSLYKKYGGVVIFQQGNPLEPVGAYRKWLEELEKAKAFEIFSPANRKEFWKYFVQDPQFRVPPELIDFETPIWERKIDLPPRDG